jgi:hypothetical protein
MLDESLGEPSYLMFWPDWYCAIGPISREKARMAIAQTLEAMA